MIVVNEWARSKQARLEYFRSTFERWPTEWLDASIESSVHLRLTPDEWMLFLGGVKRGEFD